MEITKRIMTVLLTAIVLLAVSAAQAAAVSGRSLTLLIYLCGSNLESGGGAATQDLQEITEACKGKRNVTVLAMLGGSTSWKNGMEPSESVILEIGSRGSRRILTGPAVNMGDPDALSSFLRYGAENRPADHYALILWDHGGGPLEGICYDELNGMDKLSLKELDQALSNSPFSSGLRLSWIGFDACLMASVETANCCAAYTDYMVASQETEPDSGWNYSFLSRIGETYDPVEGCRNIVDSYMAGKDPRLPLTISMVDLTETAAVQQAADRLFKKTGGQLTEKTFSALSNARRDTRSFGRASTGSEYDLADLYDLSVHLAYAAPREAADLQSALSNAVICADGNMAGAHGLSIYSPYFNHTAFSGGWLDAFFSMRILPAYQQFLEKFGGFWSGKPLADWSGLTGWAGSLTDQSVQSVFLTLTDEEAAHFADASVAILEDNGSEKIFDETYLIHDVTLENNTLRADYSFESLYAVLPDGTVTTDPIPFSYVDGYYLIEAALLKQSMIELRLDQVTPEIREGKIIFQCVKEENNELSIVRIIPVVNEDLNLGRQDLKIDPELWPYTYFITHSRRAAKDENGSMLPFSMWPSVSQFRLNLDAVSPEGSIVRFESWIMEPNAYDLTGYHTMNEADNRTEWKLKFLPRKSTGRDLFAQFLLNDTQGNLYSSSLIPLNDPDVLNTAQMTGDTGSSGGVTLQPDVMKVIRNGDRQELFFRMRASGNVPDASALYCMMYLPVINETVCPVMPLASTRLLFSGEDTLLDFHMDIMDLPPMNEKTVRSISCIPVLINALSEASPLEMNRMKAYTELDVSGLDIPERPGRFYISQAQTDSVHFQLLSLKETENGSASGTIHLVNDSDADHRVRFLNVRGMHRMLCYINGINCVCCDMPTDSWDLPPGGDAYVNFVLRTDENRFITAFTPSTDELPKELRQIMQLSFPVAVFDRTDTVDTLDSLEEKDIRRVSLNLRSPVFLRRYWQFRPYH